MRELDLLGYVVKKLLGIVGWYDFQLISVKQTEKNTTSMTKPIV